MIVAEKKCLVITYVPFLDYTSIARDIHYHNGPQSMMQDDLVRMISDHVEDLDCEARAAIWFARDNQLGVILVVPRASDLLEHMRAWGEGKLTDWFQIAILITEESYSISVIPDFERSFSRSKRKDQVTDLHIDDARYFAIPITFNGVAGKINAFKSAIPFLQNHKEIMVSFIDADLVDSENPPTADKLFALESFDVGKLKLVMRTH